MPAIGDSIKAVVPGSHFDPSENFPSRITAEISFSFSTFVCAASHARGNVRLFS